ncbi:MAG: NAD(P)-dependent oxidoreductase, partial [Anaerolineales bacterium]|nr:NAD(P)-dependent oxidoreductase [Anaerolineales bacterium]
MSGDKPHILITSRFDNAAVTQLREYADVDMRPNLAAEELENCIGEYDALIVDSETYVPDRTIEYGYRLQVIGVAGPALDNVSVSAARAGGIEVVNVPDPQTLAAAEQTMGALLTQAHSHGPVGLAGRTLGIIGFGGVGHQVALRARAFDMHVLVHQPRLTPELALTVGVELRDLPDLLTEADFISVHLSESPETKGLLGADELALCRENAVLINVG